ncbi:MAG: DUF1848 domain-containing protein [Chlorobium sp.]|nr:DUF1848 domain-containing protein [Chlorobium sp.]
MIISVSRRSDIPAFYGEWFMNRLRAGEVLVRNPMQKKQVSRILLTPQTVDAFVFWTKDPTSFLCRLPEIKSLGYPFYFLFTLTPYDGVLEPGVPEKERMVEVFRKLSQLIGADNVVWRYDPVILSNQLSPAWHVEAFNHLAEALAGYTKRCIISFLDDYQKVRRRMQAIRYQLPDKATMGELAALFAESALRNGMALCTCSHDIDLSHLGIMHSRCIDGELIERLSGRTMGGIKKASGQRHACRCVESRDIGSYNTCPHGCLYCYAVSTTATALTVHQRFDPLSPLLCDTLRGDEIITTAAVRKSSLARAAETGLVLQQGELWP